MRIASEPFAWFLAAGCVASGVAAAGHVASAPGEALAARGALDGPGPGPAIGTGLFVVFAALDIVTTGHVRDETQSLAPDPIDDARYARWLEDWERSEQVTQEMRSLAGDACADGSARVRHRCVADTLDAEIVRRVELRRRWDLALLASGAPWMAGIVLLVRFRRHRRRGLRGAIAPEASCEDG